MLYNFFFFFIQVYFFLLAVLLTQLSSAAQMILWFLSTIQLTSVISLVRMDWCETM